MAKYSILLLGIIIATIASISSFCSCHQQDQLHQINNGDHPENHQQTDVQHHKVPIKKIIGNWEYEIGVPYQDLPITTFADGPGKFKHWAPVASGCTVNHIKEGAITEIAAVKRIDPRILHGDFLATPDQLWDFIKHYGARRSVCCAAKCNGEHGTIITIDASPVFKKIPITRKNTKTGKRETILVEYATELFACMCGQGDTKFHERTTQNCPLPEGNEQYCCNVHGTSRFECQDYPKWAAYALR